MTSPYYYTPRVDSADHTLVSFAAPVPARPRQRPQWQIPSDSQEDIDDDSEMWKMFLDEVKEEDIRITDAWKEDANSIVVFTGLFSAIVGAFIIEFYKNLSSDSGDQTVALLQQISQQLPNSPNSTNSNTANQLSSQGIAMVLVIAMWLISLVLSLTCALIATLLQQWARRYIETPKSAKTLRNRARVRSLLLVGTKLYKIPLIVDMLPTLLHLSVYLFLAGLVITFHTINKKVAIAVDVAVGVSGVAYLTLSILPCLDVRCPYRTPISQVLWYPCHACLSFAALCLHKSILGLHTLLNRSVRTRGQVLLHRWLLSRGFSVSNHWQFLTDGLEKSIFCRAVTTLRDGDRGKVIWLFNQLARGDRHTFLKFAASMPIHKIPDLIPSVESISFRESLLVLLRVLADTRPGLAAWLDSDVYRRSLLVCLHAIHHILTTPDVPESYFVPTDFANIRLMRTLLDDGDTAVRVTSRSICALIARRVGRERWPEEQELRWLQYVTGETSHEILNANDETRDRMNFKSFVYGALSSQVGDLTTEDATSFRETLAILLDVRADPYFILPYSQNQLSEEVRRMQQDDPEGSLDVVNRLLLMFPFIPLPVPMNPPVPPH